jgi:hypothetical protein
MRITINNFPNDNGPAGVGSPVARACGMRWRLPDGRIFRCMENYRH